MWVSEAPGGIQQVFAFHLCLPSAGCWRTQGRYQTRDPEPMWLFCVGEGLEMALGQESQRVVGADPRWRLAEPRTRSRTRSGGVSIPHVSRGWLVQPGETPGAAGAAGDGTGPGDAVGHRGSRLRPLVGSKAGLPRVPPQRRGLCPKGLFGISAAFLWRQGAVFSAAELQVLSRG